MLILMLGVLFLTVETDRCKLKCSKTRVWIAQHLEQKRSTPAYTDGGSFKKLKQGYNTTAWSLGKLGDGGMGKA